MPRRRRQLSWLPATGSSRQQYHHCQNAIRRACMDKADRCPLVDDMPITTRIYEAIYSTTKSLVEHTDHAKTPAELCSTGVGIVCRGMDWEKRRTYYPIASMYLATTDARPAGDCEGIRTQVLVGWLRSFDLRVLLLRIDLITFLDLISFPAKTRRRSDSMAEFDPASRRSS